jgi:molybdopterin synthase sulfur carrier subunit
MPALQTSRPLPVQVRIPGLLRSYTDGAERVEIDVRAAAAGDAPRLAEGLAALEARFPGLRFRIIDEQGRIRPHIKLFVDGVQARDPGAALPAGAELMIVGALSGG